MARILLLAVFPSVGYHAAMQVRAKIEDPTHLRLSQPLDVKIGSFVVLEIVETVDHDAFLDSSAALLESVYGADEPDYSTSGTLIEN